MIFSKYFRKFLIRQLVNKYLTAIQQDLIIQERITFPSVNCKTVKQFIECEFQHRNLNTLFKKCVYKHIHGQENNCIVLYKNLESPCFRALKCEKI